MRLLVAIGAMLALGACDKPEVSGCEEYIKSTLRSPATFKRLEVDVSDRNSSAEEIAQLGGTASFSLPETKWGIRTVAITYDAANAYGTKVRERGLCLFKRRDGVLTDDARAIAAKVAHAKLMEEMRGLAAQGGLPNVQPKDLPPKRGVSCCL